MTQPCNPNLVLIRDPLEVARLGLQRHEENWRFAAWVRLLSARYGARIDSQSEQFARSAAAAMDCRSCAACCRENCIPLSEPEIERLASLKKLEASEFERQFMTRDDDGQPALDARPCPFLLGRSCAIYAHRPEACRGYPYPGGHVASEMTGIIERAGVCPIVAATLEAMKDFLRFPR